MWLLLIDDEGEIWRGDSRELRAAFDSPYSGGEFVDYAVKNLGFVAINGYGASCQLRLRSTFVTEKTALSMQEWLKTSRFERVVISRFEQDWSNELLRLDSAIARLESLFASASSARTNDFLSTTLKPSGLQSKPLISDIIEGWPHLISTYEADLLVRLVRSVIGDQYVVIKEAPAKGKLQFQELGLRMFVRHETWRNCAIGAPIEEQPDRRYGKWVSQVYREVLADGTPRLDSVDVIIRDPILGRSRRRYRRLLLPVLSNSDGGLLIGGSFDDPTVDLRIPGRQPAP